MATDYTKDQDEILVALVNENNGRNFSTSDLDLNSLAIAPDDVPGRESFNNVRTSLRVDAAANSGYKNGVTVSYNRVNLRSVFPNNDASSVRYPVSTDAGYQLQDRVNLVDILADINAKYSINIKAADVFDVPLPTFSGPPPYDPAYVRLEMQSGHKVFIGGVNVRILPNDWNLNNLQYTEMNGLVYPSYDPDQDFVDLSNAVADQFTLLGNNGGWNYTPQLA